MTLTKLKYIGALVLGTFVLAFFQNCGEQVSFEQVSLKGGSDLASQIEFIDERTVTGLDDLDLDSDSSVGLDQNDEVATDDQPSSDDGNQHSNLVVDMPVVEQPTLNRKENRVRRERKESDRSLRSSNTLYRCVVSGNGKSQHIGLLEGKAALDISTPNTLCMSENACLNIMAEVFPVLEAKFTGYCARNKAHTHAISDGEALALVEELAN